MTKKSVGQGRAGILYVLELYAGNSSKVLIVYKKFNVNCQNKFW